MRRFCAASGSSGDPQAAVGVALDALEALLVDAARAPACSRPCARARSKAASCRRCRIVGPAVGVAAHDQRLRYRLQDLGRSSP